MKIFQYPIIVSLAFIFAFSCTSPKQSSEENQVESVQETLSAFDQKFDEVMAVHDEAMGKMGVISFKTRGIKVMIDSLSQLSITDHAEEIQKLSKVNQDLSKADDSMMNWMRTFKNPEDASEQEKLEYLDDQMKKMIKVNTAINEALEAADGFLEGN